MFQIELSRFSKRSLRNCEREVYLRILDKIKSLGINPFSSDVKRVVNRKDKVFRVRVGDYRILYNVLLKEMIIIIVSIDNRGKVYD